MRFDHPPSLKTQRARTEDWILAYASMTIHVGGRCPRLPLDNVAHEGVHHARSVQMGSFWVLFVFSNPLYLWAAATLAYHCLDCAQDDILLAHRDIRHSRAHTASPKTDLSDQFASLREANESHLGRQTHLWAVKMDSYVVVAPMVIREIRGSWHWSFLITDVQEYFSGSWCGFCGAGW